MNAKTIAKSKPKTKSEDRSQSESKTRVPLTFETALLPILVFAPVVAVLCWTAAWIFRDEFVFKGTLIGLGCFPIVVAVVAYLLVLLKKLDRS